MTNGTTSAVETSAVTVVGLGTAGCRMLQAVAELEGTINPGPTVEYVAIDSDRYSLADAPEDAVSIPLDPDRTAIESALETANTRVRHIPQYGTARQRPLGRHLVDNPDTFDRVYDALAEAIQHTHEEETGSGAVGGHQVWILHALGGGTGSGAGPLVAAIVDEILTGLEGETALGVLGSLPRLDVLDEQMTRPGGDPRFYVNAYAALREYAVLLEEPIAGVGDDADDDGFPRHLPVVSASDATAMAADELRFDEPPIDAFGLLAVTERATENYRDVVNEIAAQTVHGFAASPLDSRATGINRFEDPQTTGLDERLFSVDGSQVRMPVDALREYAELGRECDEVDEQIERLQDQKPELEDALDFVESVRRPDSTKDDQRSLPDPDVTYLNRPNVEGRISDVQDDLDEPDRVDGRLVAAYLCAASVTDRLASELSEHPFRAELEAAHQRYGSDVDNLVGPDQPLEYWENALEPYLEDRIEQIRSERDDTLFPFTSRLDEVLAETRNRHEKLSRLASEYRELHDLHQWVQDRYDEGRAYLRDRRSEFESRLEETEEQLAELRERRASIDHRREAIREHLESTDVSPYVMEAPVTDVDAAVDLLDDEPAGLAALADTDVVETSQLEAAAERALSALAEPVEDHTDPADPDTLFVHASEPRAALDELLSMPQPPSVLDRSIDDPYAIRFTATYTPIDLHETSEFGTLHDWFVDEDRDVSTQLGDRVDDAVVAESIAYPELLPEDVRDPGSAD